ncbi:MAG: hypothetical protein FJ029_11230 [Actinobacteria bacterium]|nr:hypothetical protein [Actinomycetota bacterium]
MTIETLDPDTIPTDAPADYFGADLDLSFLDQDDAPPPSASNTLRPGPGKYFLRVGVAEVAFDPGRSGENERGAWTIPASIKVKPMFTIEADATGDESYKGVGLSKSLTLDTVPLKGRNFSTLTSFLVLMGLEMPRLDESLPPKERAVALTHAVQAKMGELVGMVTPIAVAVTLNGSIAKDAPRDGHVRAYKTSFTTAAGGRVYLDEKLFRTGDQSLSLKDYQASRAQALLDGVDVPGWAIRGFIVDFEDPRFTLERPPETVQHAVVWANLETTRYAFKDGR